MTPGTLKLLNSDQLLIIMRRIFLMLIISVCLASLFSIHVMASETVEKSAEEHFLMGNAFYSFGLADNATREYLLAVEKDPSLSDAWNNLGLSLTKQGKYDRSILALQNATRLAPADAEAWYNLGYSYGMLGKSEEELAAYEKAISLRPNMTVAWRNIGALRFEQGDYTAAEAALENATRYDPGSATGWYYLGTVYEKTGNLTGAVTVLKKAIQLDQNLTMAKERLTAVEKNVTSATQQESTTEETGKKAPGPAAVGILALGITALLWSPHNKF